MPQTGSMPEVSRARIFRSGDCPFSASNAVPFPGMIIHEQEFNTK
jgi:hypothetical protein